MTKKDLIELSKQTTHLDSCVDCIKSIIITAWMNDYDNLGENIPEDIKSIYKKVWNDLGDLESQIARLEAFLNIHFILDHIIPD